ncbi:hypothetical protein HmCmsJML009_03941 [Escherichia coli]|nr:hypothetical protein HmCmsJML009_03941 [Escherichia coli]
MFKDASGTINVDIDHKRWNGVTVTPKYTVEIPGEVDKDWNSVEIDAKQNAQNKPLFLPPPGTSTRDKFTGEQKYKP